MSMNKLMHPRNPYRKRPDFKQLAIDYPEFRKYAKQDLSGKIEFNFKDQGAVWALTKCLLKRDFGLEVEILPDRLVPTLPLRFNYLLWIEDLLGIYKPKVVNGIDIGTGASCIYPLLAAKHFNWKMLGTEIDIASTKCAMANVENNFLTDKIIVKAVSEDIVLDGAIDEDTIYDFCMCNPPFFSDSEELKMENKSRKPDRKPPSNAPSGIPAELLTPGGELVFIARIIADSEKLKDRIRIFTVMVGKKSNLKHLKELVRECEDISSVSTSMFCQGRTTRWGLAWTFVPGFDLNKAQHVTPKKKALSFAPFTYNIPITDEVNFEAMKSKILALLHEHKIETDYEESMDSIMITIKCFENTWINSRKKRRQERKLQQKKEESAGNSGEQMDVDIHIDKNQISSPSDGEKCKGENVSSTGGAPSESNRDFSINQCDSTDKRDEAVEATVADDSQKQNLKRPNDDETPENNKRPKIDSDYHNRPEYLVASLIMKENDDSTELCIEMYFIEGTGGKDAANQLMTFMKNRLKCS